MQTLKLPVLVLSGFLGAGKTTVLKQILEHSDGKTRLALIVNDMAELNLDAKLIRSSSLLQTGEKLVEMQNGCICCTLREDLLVQVRELAQSRQYDYLVIESTGISEPMPVAETFSFRTESGESLSDLAYIDAMVTVVDAHGFMQNFRRQDSLVEASLGLDEEDHRPIAQLLTDQIEFADILILNKVDLVDEELKSSVTQAIHALNPDAEIVEAVHGSVPLPRLIHTGRFDLQSVSQRPGWLQVMTLQRTSEKDEYGISGVVFQERRPFHPERFLQLVKSRLNIPGLLRAKGTFWLANFPDYACEWNLAGGVMQYGPTARWLAAMPASEWNLQPEEMKDLEKIWHPDFGDRVQEMVFIGVGLQEDVILPLLHSCLLTDSELALGSTHFRDTVSGFEGFQTV